MLEDKTKDKTEEKALDLDTIETDEPKEKPVRARGFIPQRNYYYDTHDEDGNVTDQISEQDWKNMIIDEWNQIAKSDGVVFFNFIFHDKDKIEKTTSHFQAGDPKPLHVHGVIKFTNPRTQSAVMKMLGTSSEQNTQSVKSYVGSSRYMLHATPEALDKKKHVYDLDLVFENGVEHRELMASGKGKKKNEDGQDIVTVVNKLSDEIRSGFKSLDDAKKEILHDFDSLTWHRFRADLKKDDQEYIRSLSRKAEEDGRNLVTAFVSGRGGIGKSKLMREGIAKNLMTSRGIHKLPKGSRKLTFDIAGRFNGQRVSIGNDFVPAVYYEAESFMGQFDPYEYDTTMSRNTDKDFLPDIFLFTNSLHLEDNLFDILFYTGSDYSFDSPRGGRMLKGSFNVVDKAWQIARRIRFDIRIEEHEIVVRRIKKDFTKWDLKQLDKAVRNEHGGHDKSLFGHFYEELGRVGHDGLLSDDKKTLSKKGKKIAGFLSEMIEKEFA